MKKKEMKKKTTKKTMKKAGVLARSYKSTGGAIPDPDPREAAAMINQDAVPVGVFGAPPSTSAFGSAPSTSFGGGTAPRTGFGGGGQGGFGAPNQEGFGSGGPGGFGGGQNREKSNFDFVTVLFSGKEGKSYSATIKNDERGNKVMAALLSIRPGDAIGISKTKAPDKYGRVSLNLWIRRAKADDQGGGGLF